MEPFSSPFWHSLALPWGGLVTTADGALSLVRTFAGVPDGFLPSDLLAQATRNQTAGLPLGLGVERRGRKAPHWTSAAAGPTSFGHAGSSGCLAWADPAAGVAWAMLAPRTFEHW